MWSLAAVAISSNFVVRCFSKEMRPWKPVACQFNGDNQQCQCVCVGVAFYRGLVWFDFYIFQATQGEIWINDEQFANHCLVKLYQWKITSEILPNTPKRIRIAENRDTMAWLMKLFFVNKFASTAHAIKIHSWCLKHHCRQSALVSLENSSSTFSPVTSEMWRLSQRPNLLWHDWISP